MGSALLIANLIRSDPPRLHRVLTPFPGAEEENELESPSASASRPHPGSITETLQRSRGPASPITSREVDVGTSSGLVEASDNPITPRVREFSEVSGLYSASPEARSRRSSGSSYHLARKD